MLQVVFSESECGSLKLATHCGPSNWDYGLIGFVLGGTEQESTPEGKKEAMSRLIAQREKESRRAGPAGGSAGDVLCPCDALDIGPLSGPDAEKARFDLLTARLGGDFPLPSQNAEDHTQRDLLWESCRRDRERLLEGGKRGEPVRIWYSDAPYSLCGYFEVLWLLRDCKCPVAAVKMPQWMPLEDGTVLSCMHWGEVAPGDWAAYLPLEREVPQNVRMAAAAEWTLLRGENAPLRVVLNGRLHSAEENFYDPFIRACIPDEPFRVGQLIAEVIGRCQLGIGDWWIAKRIQAMESRGELKLVSEGDCCYQNVMQKVL